MRDEPTRLPPLQLTTNPSSRMVDVDWGHFPYDIWTIVYAFSEPQQQGAVRSLSRRIHHQFSEAVKQRRIAAAAFWHDPTATEEDRGYFPLCLRSKKLGLSDDLGPIGFYINVALLAKQPKLCPVPIRTDTEGIHLGDRFGMKWEMMALVLDEAEQLVSVGDKWLMGATYLTSFDLVRVPSEHD